MGAAGARDEIGVAQADDQLLQVGPGEILFGGNLRQRRRPGPEMTAELDHQADAVLALRAERDGAAAMEGGPVRRGWDRRGSGQGTVLNPE